MKFSILSLLTLTVCATSSLWAVPYYGENITISDKNNDGSNPAGAGNWYSDREDNETETNPSTVTQQVWDLEGMYLFGGGLTIVGGFDFKNGVEHGGYTYKGGDIFIDIGADSAKYGQLANGGSGVGGVVPNSFGYDYVIDILSFGPTNRFSYNIVQLTPDSLVNRGLDVASSNPWTYVSGGTVVLSSLGVYGQLTPEEVASLGLLGDGGNNTHNYIGVDISSVPGIWGDNIFHYTMECGNDNLMGRATLSNVPDAASTAMLLGVAFAGVVGLRRRFCA
jgi:hypothetical protein